MKKGVLFLVFFTFFTFIALSATMTFSSGASETGFSFSGWSGDNNEIWLSNLASPATISKNSGTWNLTSFQITSFFGDNQMRIESNKGDSRNFSTNSAQTITLNWTGITSVTFTRTSGSSASSGYDNFVYEAIAAVAPTITTNNITIYNTNSATLGGNITADGGAAVSERGVVYSSSDNTPTIGEGGVTKDTNGSGTGSFNESIGALSPGTTYYVQAYATNSAGTAYGGVKSFTTIALAEINIKGNGVSIIDGDISPVAGDNTDFGNISVNSVSIEKTFMIENTGGTTLNLTDVSPYVSISGHTADFSLTQTPSSSVSGGGSTTFAITFNPTTAGLRSATISIANSDADEDPYNFNIQGTGVVIPGLWTGATDSDWSTASNWDDGNVPTGVVDVTIPNGCANYPVIDEAAVCQDITIQNGGTVTINNGFSINVSGDFLLENGGIFTNNGTLRFSGADSHITDNRGVKSTLGNILVEE